MSRSRGSARSAAQQAEAVEPRHHHVGQHEVGQLRAGSRPAPPRRRPPPRRRSCALEQPRDVVAHVGVVVGQQDATAAAAGARVRAGSASRTGGQDARRCRTGVRRPAASAAPPRRRRRARCRRGIVAAATCESDPAADARGRTAATTVNVRAAPGSLSTPIVPPCSRTSSCTSARPMPVPSMRAAALRPRPGGSVRTAAAARRRECRRRCRCTVSSARRRRRGAQARRAMLPSKRELERVREQVEDDLLPHVAIDVDRLRQAAGNRRSSCEPGAFDRRAEVAGQFGGERGEVGRPEASPAPARPRCARNRAAC